MEPVVIALSVLSFLLLLLLLALLLIRTKPKPQQSDQSLLMLQQQLNGLQQRLDAFARPLPTISSNPPPR